MKFTIRIYAIIFFLFSSSCVIFKEGRMPLMLESEARNGVANTIINIPIKINATEAYEINAFGIRFNFDNESLEFIDVVRGGLTIDWNTIGGFEDAIGHVNVGGYRGVSEPIVDAPVGVLCELRFKIIKEIRATIEIYELLDDIANFEPSLLIIFVNEEVTMERNWYPVTAPEWDVGVSASNLKSLINELRERGFTHARPTPQEQIEYFANARCAHGDNVIGRILISPSNIRFPIALCQDDVHRDILVPFPPYCCGAGSRNFEFVG